ncbi:MAG: ribonuclease P protein component [Candidatus Riflebacteria bacterium HGW-Riflebacteria-2]|nr:MAG: ribonuclease P protein component [Candidatus Riflebacteria bacterium HGW-Riflebacteria-2]
MGNPQDSGRATLRAHSDFQRVFKEGTRFFRDGLGFCVRKAAGATFRFGLSVPKRFGNAVLRNQLRRRIREIIRHSASLPESAELVICVNRSCTKFTFASLRSACEWAFAKAARIRLTVQTA